MPEKFNCSVCGNELIVLNMDTGKEAECNKCRTWNPIPALVEHIDAPLNCRVQRKNNVMDLPSQPTTETVSIKEIPVIEKKPPVDTYNTDNTSEAEFEKVKTQFKDNIVFRNMLYNATPKIYFTRSLVILNVAIFFSMVLSGVSLFDPKAADLIMWGAKDNFKIVSGFEWWRLASSFFIHAGFIHLALNMFVLWIIGSIAERMFGNSAFCAIYFVSGFGGSLASLFISPGVSVGASGAVMGIAGALIAFFLNDNVRIPTPIKNKLLRDIIIFAGITILLGFLVKETDNSCHIGGFAAGFLAGLLMRRPLPVMDKRVRWLRYAILVSSTLAVISASIFISTMFSPPVKSSELSSVEQLFKQGRTDEALVILEKHPELIQYFNAQEIIRGLMYAKKGDYDNAIRSFSAYLDKNPKSNEVRIRLAEAYINKQQYGKAITALREAIKIAPTNGIAYGHLGWAYYCIDDFNNCISLSNKALELDSSLTYVRYNIALSYLRLNEIEKSIGYYREAIGKDEDKTSETRKGAIADLKDLIKKRIMAKEAGAILKSIFGLEEEQLYQSDLSAKTQFRPFVFA